MTFPIARKEVQGSNDEEVTRNNGTKQAIGNRRGKQTQEQRNWE